MSVGKALGEADKRRAAGQAAPSKDPVAGPSGPRMVPLAAIVGDRDFDARAVKVDPEQVATILQGMRNGIDVQPPVLWQCPEDGQFRVLDGWQRIMAFHQWKGGDVVPAEVRECSRTAAVAEAIRLRATQGTLPLTKDERMNAAWRLVRAPLPPGSNREHAYSRSEVMRLTGVSDGTVSTMRRRLKALQEAETAPTGEWRRDRQDGLTPAADMTDAERTAFIAEVTDAVTAVLAPFRRKDDQALIEGIAGGLGSRLTAALLDYLGGGEEGPLGEAWSGDDPTAPVLDF